MSSYRIREMQLSESHLMIRYFLHADMAYLQDMGVDPEKLPEEEAWSELLREDFARPLQARQFFYLVWEADGAAVGHCNINKICFAKSAYMHLHIWKPDYRRQRCATALLRPSIETFFERFELRTLYCEPYALNPAPNRTLPKVGFRLVKTYETIPGWITFHQTVNLWELSKPT